VPQNNRMPVNKHSRSVS